MQNSEGATVVLADDHNIVREGIASLCAANGMRILGEVADGPAAIEMILERRPDFAIIDLHMPTMTGVEVIGKLRDAGCQAKLLILSVSREEATVVQALFAGADAYMLKDGPGRHLMDAINFVREGGVYVSPLLRGAGLFTHGEKNRQDDPLAGLSPREAEVFSYLMDGMRAKDIADLLEISPKTVDTYRASLMRKLDVHGMVGLVKFALELNLANPSMSR
jgi:DNA-binding NarL/FixJ family response regulator